MPTESILIVEDDAHLRDGLAYNLERAGYEVRCAGTAADGLEAARTASPDLVVLDLMLPDGSGMDVLAKLRAEKLAAPVAAEMVEYFCLHTELVLSAESILLAREKGIDVDVGKEIQDKLLKMHGLEKHIGRAGMRTLRPHLEFTAKDMWEIHLLEDEAISPHHS